MAPAIDDGTQIQLRRLRTGAGCILLARTVDCLVPLRIRETGVSTNLLIWYLKGLEERHL